MRWALRSLRFRLPGRKGFRQAQQQFRACLRRGSGCIMPRVQMNPPSSIGRVPSLSAKQRSALVTLLADDDPGIYQTVRRKILAYGPEACEWLRPHTLSTDPVLRRRAIEALHYLLRQDADNRFLTFCL